MENACNEPGHEAANAMCADTGRPKTAVQKLMLVGAFCGLVVALKLVSIPFNVWPSFPDETFYVNSAQSMAHYGVLIDPANAEGLAPKFLRPSYPPLYSMALVPACLVDTNPARLPFYFYVTNVILTSLSFFPAFYLAVYYRSRHPLAVALFVALSVPLTRYVMVNMSENLFSALLVFWLSAYVFFYSRKRVWSSLGAALLLAATTAALVLCRKVGLSVLPAMALGFVLCRGRTGRPTLAPWRQIPIRLLILLPAVAAHQWTMTYLPQDRQTVESYLMRAWEPFAEGGASGWDLVIWFVRPFFAQYFYLALWTGGLLVYCAAVVWMWRCEAKKAEPTAGSGLPVPQMLSPAWVAFFAGAGVTLGGVMHCLTRSTADLSGGSFHPKYLLYDRYVEPVMVFTWLFIACVLTDRRMHGVLWRNKLKTAVAGLAGLASMGAIAYYLLRVGTPCCGPLQELTRQTGANVVPFMAFVLGFSLVCIVAASIRWVWWVPLLLLVAASYWEALVSGHSYQRQMNRRTHVTNLKDLRGEALSVWPSRGIPDRPVYSLLGPGQGDAYGLVNVFFQHFVVLESVEDLYRKKGNPLYYSVLLREFMCVQDVRKGALDGSMDLIAGVGQYRIQNKEWRTHPEDLQVRHEYIGFRNVSKKIPDPHPDFYAWKADLPAKSGIYQNVVLPESTKPGGVITAEAWLWYQPGSDLGGLTVGACGLDDPNITKPKEGTWVPVGKVGKEPRAIRAEHVVEEKCKRVRFVLWNGGDEGVAFWVAKPALYYKHPAEEQ